MATLQGTAGDDSLVGTAGGDDFHVEQGGADTVIGGDGIDVFYFGGSLGAGDNIDGGTGADFLVLDGDYSAGVDFSTLSMVGVETVQLVAGHSYDLTGFSNPNLVSGKLTIDAHTLGVGDHVDLDASGIVQGHQSGTVAFTGGAGDDTLVGGFGDDTLTGGAGDNSIRGGDGNDTIVTGVGDSTLGGGRGSDNFTIGGGVVQVQGGADNDHVTIPVLEAGTVLDGGDGDFDSLFLSGNHQTYALDGHNAINFETISIGAFDHLTLDGSLSPKGSTLTLEGARGAKIDAHEARGDLHIIGPGLHDVLIGGSGNDIINAGTTGATQVTGGKGGDTLTGGHGFGQHEEGATFFYKSIKDSKVDNPDLITDLGNDQTIDLHKIDADIHTAGDQAFHLVSAFDGHAGELVRSYDSFRNVTSFSGDVDGDGQADFTITANGSHTDFSGFTL